MNWNDHSKLKGLHANLGGSNYHWINYDDKRFITVFTNLLAKERGTRLHALACECIKLKIRQRSVNKTFNMYVNDCIGFGMEPEVVLFYSPNVFGTADAISFKDDILRISDLKTGLAPAKMDQLEIYAAIFCLEYHYRPHNLKGIVLSLYQNNEIQTMEADFDRIQGIMDKAVHFDKVLGDLKENLYE